MVGGNEVLDCGGEFVFVGELEAVLYMLDDDLGTLLVGERVVRILLAGLVLGEEDGILELSYVVIESASPYQLHLSAQFVGHLGCEICHLHAMVESAVCLLGKSPQQRVVDVLEFDERHDTRKAENALYRCKANG